MGENGAESGEVCSKSVERCKLRGRQDESEREKG